MLLFKWIAPLALAGSALSFAGLTGSALAAETVSPIQVHSTVTPHSLGAIKATAFRTSPPATTLGERLADLAVKYIGDPYVWGGSSPSGFDCSGLTHYVFSQFNITLPSVAADQANLGTYVPESKLQPGDLVFFNTDGSGISHVGIYIGSGQFVNAASTKVEIDNINDPFYWASRYVTARRIS